MTQFAFVKRHFAHGIALLQQNRTPAERNRADFLQVGCQRPLAQGFRSAELGQTAQTVKQRDRLALVLLVSTHTVRRIRVAQLHAAHAAVVLAAQTQCRLMFLQQSVRRVKIAGFHVDGSALAANPRGSPQQRLTEQLLVGTPLVFLLHRFIHYRTCPFP